METGTTISRRSWRVKRLREENRKHKATGVLAFVTAPSIAYEVHADATVTTFLPARRRSATVWQEDGITQFTSTTAAREYAEYYAEYCARFFAQASATYA